MKEYTEIKQELSRRCRSTKHFTREFFKVYQAARETIKRNVEQGINDVYYDGDILTCHAWDEVRKTDFYLKNSGAYCEFLCIVA